MLAPTPRIHLLARSGQSGHATLRTPTTCGLKMNFQTLGSQSPQIGRDACHTITTGHIGSRAHYKTHVGRGAPGDTPLVSHGTYLFLRVPSSNPREGFLHFVDASTASIKLGHCPTTYGYDTCYWADWCPFSRRETCSTSSITGHAAVAYSVAQLDSPVCAFILSRVYAAHILLRS
jgi:hypothetical protein